MTNMLRDPLDGLAHAGRKRPLGSVMIAELVVATALVVGALLPLSMAIFRDTRVLRAEYCRAAIMELILGELEVLRSGGWTAWPEGRHEYPISGWVITNLPEGRFILTRTGGHLRLEWIPEGPHDRGRVVYDCQIP